MASSRADCTLLGARLISSASSRLANTGPFLGLKVSERGSNTSVPTTSEGSRSGVNCTRRKVMWLAAASVLMVRVLASPGRPSSSTCPGTSRATRRRFSRFGWPTITFRHSCSRASRGLGSGAGMGWSGVASILAQASSCRRRSASKAARSGSMMGSIMPCMNESSWWMVTFTRWSVTRPWGKL